MSPDETAATPDGPAVDIRPARPQDVPAIDALVRELARYEREPDAVQAVPADLERALFGPDPRVHCHVAEVAGTDGGPGVVVGIAVWFVTWSTWRGRHGIWLEDLFVTPSHRGRGVGRRLLGTLAAECVQRGWSRLEWAVLDWNAPAQGFYRAMGASGQDDWTTWRLDCDALVDAAGTT